MAFLNDVRIPTNISRGTGGGPGHSTSALMLDSGDDVRVAKWAGARRKFNAKYGIRAVRDLIEVYEIYLVAGMVDGVRYRDPLDYTTKPDAPNKHRGTAAYDDVVIGVGDGTKTTFQLFKQYTAGAKTIMRTITKPVENTVKSGIDGVEKTGPPTGSPDFTVDTSTGEIVYGTAPGSGLDVTAGCEFDTPVLFGIELDDLFDVDLIKMLADPASATDSPGSVAEVPDIPLVEDIGQGALQPEWPYLGGGRLLDMTADMLFDYSNGLLQALDPDASGYKFHLPLIADIPEGFPVLAITNADGSFSIDVVERDGTAAFTLAAATTAIMGIIDNAGTKEWRSIKGV